MVVNDGLNPGRSGRFALSEQSMQLLNEAWAAHVQFRTLNGVPMAVEQNFVKSYGLNCQIGEHNVYVIGSTSGDQKAIFLLRKFLEDLQLEERSSILCIIEDQLEVYLDGCEAARFTPLARKIAVSEDLRVFDVDSTEANWEIIDKAQQGLSARGYESNDAVAAVVGELACYLPIGLQVNLTAGVEEVRLIMQGALSVQELYEASGRALYFSPDQMNEMGRFIDQYAVQEGYVNASGEAAEGTLYEPSFISAFLVDNPERRNDFLGFLVCSCGLSSEGSGSPDLMTVIFECKKRWGDSITLDALHRAAFSVDNNLKTAHETQDNETGAYYSKISQYVREVRMESIRAMLERNAELVKNYKNILVVSGISSSPVYEMTLAEIYGVDPQAISSNYF